MDRFEEFSRRMVRGGGIALVVSLLLCLMAGLSVSPRPAGAQPRPTLTPTPSAPPTALAPSAECGSLCGQVIDLEANVNLSGQTVRFAGSGWSKDRTTNAYGWYSFGLLGDEVGLLDLVVPEGGGLYPVTSGIPVAPIHAWSIVVNLGVYRDQPTAPPLVPTASVQPAWVRPGGRVTVTVQVRNDLPFDISGVMVTTLMPEGLALVGVIPSQGEGRQIGSYGAGVLRNLPAGREASVHFVADVGRGVPVSTIQVPVSLIYREHVAAQTVAPVRVSGAPVPVASSLTPTPAVSSSASPPVATPQTLPTTGPTLLPVTGYGLTAVGVGAAFGAVAWTARRLRHRRGRGSEKEE
ncbi:MAG TPA: DUF11 domain-containing protein [Anaerolineae bacterium]|nr:DUF11 domain-containing protein [Anaerolineae bacterium]